MKQFRHFIDIKSNGLSGGIMVDTKTTNTESVHTKSDIHTAGTEIPKDELHEIGFPPFDGAMFSSQLLWLAITFGALYWIMAKVALPRIAGILEDRHDRIASDLDEAERLKQETDKAIAVYEEALNEARSKANAIAHTTRDTLNTEVEAKRSSVENDLMGKLKGAELRIDTIRTKAMEEVSVIATDTVEAIMEVLAPGKVDRPKILAVVDECLTIREKGA